VALGFAVFPMACGAPAAPAAPAPLTPSPPAVLVPTPPAPEPPNRPLGSTRLRRLANLEIENVVADLLGERLGLTAGFLDDPRPHGYDTDAEALVVSESKFDELGTVAERVAARLTDPAHIAGSAPCDTGELPEICARRFITALSRQAWGRPADADETTRLLGVFAQGTVGGDYAAGVALAAEAMLLSPFFAYRTELGPPAAGDPTPPAGAGPATTTLTGPEIASAISFLAKGARPDAALLDAGLAGHLLEPDERALQARRLLDSPAGRAQLARFVRSWLGIDDVAVINKDLGVFPVFTPSVRAAMARELAQFLEHVFAQAGGRLDELLLADYTFPGPALSVIYGPDELLDPIGDFSRVRLDPARRRGLLSSPAFLARHALVGQTNPVERGLLVRGQLLCQELGPPPPDVQAMTPSGGPGTTTRQKYEAHQRDEACRSCHQFIDALGFGFEQFDPIGRFRTHEGANLIDASGVLNGTDVDGVFVGPAALAERLEKSAMVRRCLVQQLWRFALGREVSSGDAAEIDHLAWQFASAGQSIPQLIVAMVARPNFVLRTAVALPAPGGAP
jgi:hypothetical protein